MIQIIAQIILTLRKKGIRGKNDRLADGGQNHHPHLLRTPYVLLAHASCIINPSERDRQMSPTLPDPIEHTYPEKLSQSENPPSSTTKAVTVVANNIRSIVW